ncbi:MAG: DUF4352 domain-containing protein [Oscillospiraceae bacterium]|nr:DUF4352 domain-containing protein [Oscillospiraceae bacterium]
MSNSKMTVCKHCGAEIAKSAKVCPQCGGKNKKPIFLRWWFIALVVIIIIGAVGGGGKSGSSEAKQIGTVSQTSTSSQESGTKESASKEESRTKTNEPTPAPKSVYNVGDILLDGDIKIVYMASGDYLSDNQFLQPKEGYKYIFLEFAFINNGKSDTSISFYSFEAYADGYNVEMFYGADDDLSATLSSGRSTVGKVFFEVPTDAKEIEIEYEPNIFLDRKIKFAYEGNMDSGFILEPNTARTSGALNVGDTFENSSLRIIYLSCEDYVSDNMFVTPKSGYHYVSLSFEFENLGSSDRTISSFSFNCYADGKTCDATYIRDDDLQATISSGRKAKGSVTFEVPDGAEVIEVEFDNNIWTSDKITFTVK